MGYKRHLVIIATLEEMCLVYVAILVSLETRLYFGLSGMSNWRGMFDENVEIFYQQHPQPV